MRKKLLDINITVEVETAPGGELRVISTVPSDSPIHQQLVGVPLSIMGMAVEQVAAHLAVLYRAAQERAFEESLGAVKPPERPPFGGRGRHDLN